MSTSFRSFALAPLIAVFLLGSASNAKALCMYHGDLYAKTTLPQEFADASIVVRGTVLSSRDVAARSESFEFGVTYRVRINQTFKGNAPTVLDYFSERNSGAFYLDEGTEYLLFLNPLAPTSWASAIAPGALEVNYNCGQSRAWSEVPAADQMQLRALSTRR